MSDQNKNSIGKQILKAIGILAISVLALAAVAFGLLVGICGLMR